MLLVRLWCWLCHRQSYLLLQLLHSSGDVDNSGDFWIMASLRLRASAPGSAETQTVTMSSSSSSRRAEAELYSPDLSSGGAAGLRGSVSMATGQLGKRCKSKREGDIRGLND